MSREFQHIVRIADTDLDGTLSVLHAIARIKGVGINFANAIVKATGINPNLRVGFLSDKHLNKISSVISDPSKSGLPNWLLNRSKDLDTGKDMHLIGSNLVLQNKMDVDMMKKIKCWKGYRHAHGLKVRGQRTKVTGRKGKAIGVKKKKRVL